jgi:hypothetical protein
VLLRVKPLFRFKGIVPKNYLVAITVSTNYADLLKICLDENQGWFDHWIFITQESDKESRELLRNIPNSTVLFWNPKRGGASFDKGAAVRLGQKHAYRNFPNSWYVVIDSDIVLEGNSRSFQQQLLELSPGALHGIERQDYASLSDLRAKVNTMKYQGWGPVLGYFQLYATPHLYRSSKDASRCDLQFNRLFRENYILRGTSCAHLGQKSHWKGRNSHSGDFLQ